MKHLKTKHESVMRQFVQEVGVVELEFLKNRKAPPVGRNQPVRAGSVYWERLLYQHLKKSVIAFRKIESEPEVQNSYLKRTAFAQYFTLVADMRGYENDNFDQFLEAGIYIVNNCMKKNILKVEFSEEILLETVPKATKKNRQFDQGLKKRRQSGFFGVGRRGSMAKGKFASMATAIQWLANRPGTEDTNVQMAQKFLTAAAEISSTNDPNVEEPDQFKVKQAKVMLAATKQEYIPTWREVIGSNVLMDYKLKFAINFSYEIFDIISEGQEFEYLGFTLDPIIRMAIMRKYILFRDVEAVNNMVLEYNRIVSNLSLGEIYFLKDTIYKIETVMQAGLGRYTWQSFNITGYCEKCSDLLKMLSSMVSQIGHIENDIRNRIKKIESYNLFTIEYKQTTMDTDSRVGPSFDIKTARRPSEIHQTESIEEQSFVQSTKPSKKVRINESLIECREFFKQLHVVRDEKFRRIKKMYDSIGPILIKLESLILGTHTGESEKMELYYNFWEKETFNCATRLATVNLQQFEKQLNGDKPIFQVDAILTSPFITLRPNATEIYNILINSMKDFLKRSKIFTRWMNGTCLPCPPQNLQQETYVASFCEDLIQLSEICDIVRSIQNTVQDVVKNVQTYLLRLGIYCNIILWQIY